MTERKKNAAYWKQMRNASDTRTKEFADKYGVTLKQARLELQLIDVLAQEDQQFLIDEGLRYDSNAKFSRREEE